MKIKSRALSGTGFLFVISLQHAFCLTTVTFCCVLWSYLARVVPVPSDAGAQQSHADKQAISGIQGELVVNLYLQVAFIAVLRASASLLDGPWIWAFLSVPQRPDTSNISWLNPENEADQRGKTQKLDFDRVTA